MRKCEKTKSSLVPLSSAFPDPEASGRGPADDLPLFVRQLTDYAGQAVYGLRFLRSVLFCLVDYFIDIFSCLPSPISMIFLNVEISKSE